MDEVLVELEDVTVTVFLLFIVCSSRSSYYTIAFIWLYFVATIYGGGGSSSKPV